MNELIDIRVRGNITVPMFEELLHYFSKYGAKFKLSMDNQWASTEFEIDEYNCPMEFNDYQKAPDAIMEWLTLFAHQNKLDVEYKDTSTRIHVGPNSLAKDAIDHCHATCAALAITIKSLQRWNPNTDVSLLEETRAWLKAIIKQEEDLSE